MRRNCSKNILLIILVFLFVAFISVAIYLLIKDKQKIVKVDRYSEFLNFCDTGTQDDKFLVTCPALLLNISTSEEKGSCFEVQIMTKDHSLETSSICEPNDEFHYTNEILDYKKLLPVEIAFSYNQTDQENSYQLDSIAFNLLSEEYIQQTVNQDIQLLTEIDPTSTTIKNSVDFCPSPNLLPDYVSEENNQKYTEFYNRNILTEEEYRTIYSEEFKANFIDNSTDSQIQILFGCESAGRRGISGLCEQELPIQYHDMGLENTPTFVPNWETQTNTDTDLMYIKNISLIFDGILYKQNHLYYSSPHIINELFQIQNDAPGNQNVFCYESKLYSLLRKDNTYIQSSINTVNTLIDQNLHQISPTCTETLDENMFEKNGRYLKSLYTIKNNTAFTIYEKCNNLYLLINE